MNPAAKRKKAEEAQKKKKKRIKITVAIAAIVCLCIVAVIVVDAVKNPTNIKGTIDAEGNMHISLDKLAEDLRYINYDSNMPKIFVFAHDSGQPRVAYNTCEDCYSSGKAHYTRNNYMLVCGNCTNTTDIDDVGTEAWGGCQPVSIPASFRNDTDTEIIIPAEVLAYAKDVFASWSAGDYEVSLGDYTP